MNKKAKETEGRERETEIAGSGLRWRRTWRLGSVCMQKLQQIVEIWGQEIFWGELKGDLISPGFSTDRCAIAGLGLVALLVLSV